MQAEVLVTGWSVRGKRFAKGQVIDLDEIAGLFVDGAARLDGYRRLGFFRPLEEAPAVDLASLLKKDLQALAAKREIEVPKSATKADIIRLLGD